MQNQIVSREQWLEARKTLLAKEKELTRQHDRLSAEQRALPWVKVEKTYVFDGPSGKVTLSELFNGRSQLFVKHFMMGPGQEQQCVGCSLLADHIDGILPHLENHNVAYAAIARAPIDEIEELRRRMDWEFPFVSSHASDFNYDFNVSFTPGQIATKTAFYNFRHIDPGLEDLSGASVFYKNQKGEIFHTYSAFGRGDEQFLGTYAFLDVTPKGRDETGPSGILIDWVQPRNTYGQGGTVSNIGRYHEAGCGCGAHG